MGRHPLSILVVLAATLAAMLAMVAAGSAGAQNPPPSSGSPYELPPEPTPDRDVRPRLLTPQPIVRIVGRLTLTGARITRLSVRTVPLVRIEVRCKGRGCPTRRHSEVVPDSERRTVERRLRRFERPYRAGAVLQIHVARKGTIGKFARFRVRRGKAPRRTDKCIAYGARSPQACRGSGPGDD